MGLGRQIYIGKKLRCDKHEPVQPYIKAREGKEWV